MFFIIGGVAAAVFVLWKIREKSLILQGVSRLMLVKCREKTARLFDNGLTIDRGNNLEIVYYFRDRRFSIITPKCSGPRAILSISCPNTPDGTPDELREKLGPYGNFHGIPTTPKMLGYPNGINVVYRKGRKQVTYTNDETIITNSSFPE